jgi:hypothetical protein
MVFPHTDNDCFPIKLELKDGPIFSRTIKHRLESRSVLVWLNLFSTWTSAVIEVEAKIWAPDGDSRSTLNKVIPNMTQIKTDKIMNPLTVDRFKVNPLLLLLA